MPSPVSWALLIFALLLYCIGLYPAALFFVFLSGVSLIVFENETD